MATITLGKPPKNFSKTVTFKLLNGTDAKIECLYKYRTVTEYGAMKDEMSKDAGLTDVASATWEQIMEKRRDKGGEFLAHILDGWNLDIGFTTATLQQFADEYPGGVTAIAEDYDAAIVQGRLGN